MLRRPSAGSHAGDGEVNCRGFCQDSKNEYQDLMEEPFTAQAKEETAQSPRAGDVGAPATLGNVTPHIKKGEMAVRL
jgi:hypothetical protein